MGERVKGIMGSPFKRTSKYLTHQVFNRSVSQHYSTQRKTTQMKMNCTHVMVGDNITVNIDIDKSCTCHLH